MAKPETVHNQCIKPHFCHPHEISMQPACEKRACSSDIIRQYRLQNYVSDKKSNLTDRCLFHQLARAFLDQSKLSASILYCFWILLYQSKSSFFAILIPQIVNTTTLKIMISKTIFMRSILHHLHHYPRIASTHASINSSSLKSIS